MGSQAATGVLGALGLAALAVFVPPLWKRAQWFSTFVHEAGHALVATATGRYVEALEIFRDGGGCTNAPGTGRLSSIATGAAGYSAPPAAGLGIVAALEAGVSTRTILLVVIFVVVALLLVTGNVFGVVIVATVLAVLALLLHRAGPVSQTVAALTAAWFLLLAGLRDSLELSRVISHSGGRDDASHLAEETGIPAVICRRLRRVRGLRALPRGALAADRSDHVAAMIVLCLVSRRRETIRDGQLARRWPRSGAGRARRPGARSCRAA